MELQFLANRFSFFSKILCKVLSLHEIICILSNVDNKNSKNYADVYFYTACIENMNYISLYCNIKIFQTLCKIRLPLLRIYIIFIIIVSCNYKCIHNIIII